MSERLNPGNQRWANHSFIILAVLMPKVLLDTILDYMPFWMPGPPKIPFEQHYPELRWCDPLLVTDTKTQVQVVANFPYVVFFNP